MRSAVAVARAVPAREWPGVLMAAAVAVIVEIGLRTMTLPRLAKLLGVPLRLDDGDAVMPEPGVLRARPWVRRRLRATRRVMRHWPFGDTCLRRALVSGHRLRRLHPALRVGVAKIDGRIQAHAWLELNGVSLDPAGAAAYRTLETVRPGGGPR